MSSDLNSKKCRWGIMSTALIAQKNWQAIKFSGNGTVVAVASRDLSRSEVFIDRLQALIPFETVPRAVEGYQALIDSPDIDAVYIPLPTGMRCEWVIKAADAGKHVLCEKPCASSYADLQKMVDACKANKVQFMDGVMYMHNRRLKALRDAIDTKIGKVKRISSQFSFFGGQEFDETNIRTNRDLEPFGCLGDLGWYNIRFALWLMNYELPKKVYAHMLSVHRRDDSSKAVPVEIECGLQFDKGVTSSFYNSFLTADEQWVNVSGSQGSVDISDFVLPFEGRETVFSVSNSELSTDDYCFAVRENKAEIVVAESGNSGSNSQEANLFRNFASLALSGKTDDYWADIALMTQQVLDACKESAENDGMAIALV